MFRPDQFPVTVTQHTRIIYFTVTQFLRLTQCRHCLDSIHSFPNSICSIPIRCRNIVHSLRTVIRGMAQLGPFLPHRCLHLLHCIIHPEMHGHGSHYKNLPGHRRTSIWSPGKGACLHINADRTLSSGNRLLDPRRGQLTWLIPECPIRNRQPHRRWEKWLHSHRWFVCDAAYYLVG